MVVPFVRFTTRYLSSIAAVLLTLKLGGVESQKASLICPLLYHATIALCEHADFFLYNFPASVDGWMYMCRFIVNINSYSNLQI